MCAMVVDASPFIVSVDYPRTVEAMFSSLHPRRLEQVRNTCCIIWRESGEVTVRLIHFNLEMNLRDALAKTDTLGQRPAELPEPLALGTQNPDLQREFPVVALGTIWRNGCDDSFVPCLDEEGFDWICLPFVSVTLFSSLCRFAVVGK